MTYNVVEYDAERIWAFPQERTALSRSSPFRIVLEQRLLNFKSIISKLLLRFSGPFTGKDLNALSTKLSAKALAAAA